MEKGINLIYNDLETTIVGAMNRSGLPIFVQRDLLSRLLVQADNLMTKAVKQERETYLAGLRAEQEAAKAAESEQAPQETGDPTAAAAAAQSTTKKVTKNG